MLLRYSTASPYARKVRAAAIEKGVADRIQGIASNPWAAPPELVALNPLGKVPTLVLDDGTVLQDSPVICEYLDSLAPAPKLIPESGPARWRVLSLQSLADGAMDAAILWRVEQTQRKQYGMNPEWVARQQGQVERTLDAFERMAAAGELAGPVDIAKISIVCALGYIDFRHGAIEWRRTRPKLAAWADAFGQRPSLAETAPKDEPRAPKAPPIAEAWTHHRAGLPGLDVHYVRAGKGKPLILLHGWPEFWRGWRKNIGPLAEKFDVVAPDLRGFGETEKPKGPLRLDDLIADLGHLADHLGFGKFGIVCHDVGAWIAQAFARRHPDRLSGLFFFNLSHPGIGRRWAEAHHLIEIWYQSFHQLPLARDLVGYNRDTLRIYLRHFLGHWAGDAKAYDDDLEAWVDNFMAPGNLEGGFAWYKAINATRLALIRDGAPKLEKIAVPARVLWGANDPLYPKAWTDNIGDTFADVKVDIAEGAGHFVHYQRPDLANAEIATFFAGR